MSGRRSLTGAWFDLALNSMELMQQSAVVIGKRTAAMATPAAPGTRSSASQQREMQRMVDEKAHAAAESWTRAAFASAQAYQSMVMHAMLGGRTPSSNQWQRATIKVLGAASAPYRTKVRGNAKRLSRK